MMENKVVYGAILAVVFALGIFFRIAFLNIPENNAGADERYYLSYAKYIGSQKGASMRGIVEGYLKDKRSQVFPNPLRAGHIIISALWLKALDNYTLRALSLLSALFSILSLGIGYLFARELFGRKIALFSLILFVASPLNLALARRALQDSAVYFFSITTLYAFYKARKGEGIVGAILFAIALFITIMVKESAVLLAGFFAAVILWDLLARRYNAPKGFLLLSSIAAASLAAFCAYIYITGSIKNFLEMARIIILSPQSNFYAVKYQSGPFLRYILDFFLISPYTLLSAVAFFALYLSRAVRQDEASTYLVIFFIVFYVLFSVLSKNVRYVMALDFPIRVFTAIFVATLFRDFGKKELSFALFAVIALGLSDIFMFKYLFLDMGIYDPITFSLGRIWGLC